MTLRIHLLGQPRLFIDRIPQPFAAPPKTMPLLAYLLLHRERMIERQQVAFALWPDESESEARANLRRHIHQLMRALPPAPANLPWLITDAHTLRWNPQADYWLDIAEFETQSAQPSQMEEAIGLYTGDLLENNYDDWIFFERERLRNLFLDFLSRLVIQQRSERNFSKAILFAQKLLQSDPFREDALRQLVSLRYESGDRAGALQEYENFEHRLRDEMGVVPMPETRTLAELVRRNARLPGIDNSQAEIQTTSNLYARPAKSWLLPFVGRDGEMQTAAARWNRAVRGHGGLLLVGGEAGVGKSRLAREIAILVENQGGRVLFGAVSPTQARAYHPIIEAFEASLPLLEGLTLSPIRMAALASLIPQLFQDQKLPPLPTLEPDRERIRLFDALAASIEVLAGPRPLLFILEDLHWAGEATLDLINFLARRAAGKPILLLGTYRDEETPRSHPLRNLRRNLQSEALADHIALGRLTASAVQSLLAQMPADWLPSQDELSTRLFSESEGHPLLIDQLLEHWHQAGLGVLNELPGDIRSIILSRLSHLPENCRAYAEVASLLGAAFNVETVREVGGWNEAQAHTALSGLLDNRLVRDIEGRSHFDYAFAHHLIQSVLYEEIPIAKRKRRHLRAAEVLQEIFPERRQELIGELARHFDAGDDAARAIPCYFENAQHLVTIFADSEALASINRALELGDKGGTGCPPATIFDFLMLRQGIHKRKGLPEKQYRDLLRLREIASASGDAQLEFTVLEHQIQYQRDQRDLPTALQLVEEIKQCTARLNTRYWRTMAAQVEGQTHIANNNFIQAERLLRQALATWEDLGDKTNQLYCICYLADIIHVGRQANEIENLLQKALVLSKETISPAQFMRALLSAANSGVVNSNPQRTLQYATQLVTLAEQVGDLGWIATGTRLIGVANAHLFNIQEGRANLKNAAQIFLAIQRLKPYAQTLDSMGSLEISVGRYEQAREHYQQSLDINQQLNQLDGICIAQINLAFACSLQGDFATEKAYAEKAIESSRKLGNRYLEASALQNLGDAELFLNQLDAALENFQTAQQIMQSLGQQRELTSILCDIAKVYLAMKRFQPALEMTEQILALYPQIVGTDDNLHRHLWTAAHIFHAIGQEEKAAHLLAQAHQEFTIALNAIPDAESRQAFSQIIHNRQIADAHEKGIWPDF